MGTENIITEAKAVDLYAPVPVAVHRWFADGAGWAYHPEIDDRVLEEIIRTVTPILYSSENESRGIHQSAAGLLVVEKFPQDDCDDASAVARSPHVLRVAVLSHAVWNACHSPEQAETEWLESDLFRQFGRLSDPKSRGRCESLIVWAKAAPPKSPKPEVCDEPTKQQHAHVDDLAKENGVLAQKNAELRRQIEFLMKAASTRGQRLGTSIILVLVTALLTAALVYMAVVNSGLP